MDIDQYLESNVDDQGLIEVSQLPAASSQLPQPLPSGSLFPEEVGWVVHFKDEIC